MATHFEDSFIVFALDPSNGPIPQGFKSTYQDAIDVAKAWAEGDPSGLRYAVFPALAIAKDVS